MSFLDWFRREPVRHRQSEVSTQPLIESFWATTYSGAAFSPRLIDRVWSANRCVQLNSQQIASMPLKWFGSPSSTQPAWVANPDPVWFPNGIGDAVFAAVRSIYGWGDAFLYITSRYENGFPSGWTVLDPEPMIVERDEQGRRTYRSGETKLNRDNIVQVSRNPTGALRGTSALAAYGSQMLAAISNADTERAIVEGGTPNAVLKSKRKLTEEQAIQIQNQWVERSALRRGAPAILPPDLEFEELSFSPKDLLLLEGQEFNARVIAAAFGVPPFMLNLPLTGGLTYQNPAMLGEFWWRFELRPCARRIENALTANMLPRGSFVRFDASDTFAPLIGEEGAPEELEESPVAPATPAQQSSNGVVAELRPTTGINI